MEYQKIKKETDNLNTINQQDLVDIHSIPPTNNHTTDILFKCTWYFLEQRMLGHNINPNEF